MSEQVRMHATHTSELYQLSDGDMQCPECRLEQMVAGLRAEVEAMKKAAPGSVLSQVWAEKDATIAELQAKVFEACDMADKANFTNVRLIRERDGLLAALREIRDLLGPSSSGWAHSAIGIRSAAISAAEGTHEQP